MDSKKWEWCLALDLLLLPMLITGVQDPPPVIAMTGSNATLQIHQNQSDRYKRVTWLFTTKQKIVEWDSSTNTSKIFESEFKNRTIFNQTNFLLEIYNVRKEDEGIYYLRVLKDGGEKQWSISLKVFDPVPQPSIKIGNTEELHGFCHLNLSCVIDNQTVNYTWYKDSGSFPKEFNRSVLEIVVEPQKYSKFYTCQVSNLVSNKNDTVYFIPPCTLARSSGVKLILTWMAVMAPVIFARLMT